MLKKISLGVLVIVAVLLVAIVTRPATFRVERSVTIAAPADVVFEYVNDFHKSEQWNPFLKGDSTTKVTYSGAPAGVGAIYEWEGSQVGAGRQEIVESRPNEYVKIDLAFLKPLKSVSTAEFTIKPVTGGQSLTWVMAGDNTFLGKTISLVASMDRMIGSEFEKGLADIKTHAEADATRRMAEAKPAGSTATDTAAAKP